MKQKTHKVSAKDFSANQLKRRKELRRIKRLATQNWLRAQGRDALTMLTPREIRILQLRYGLLDGESCTLEEVGRKMGVTRERVRQIEAKALTRLRHKEAMRRLEEEVKV